MAQRPERSGIMLAHPVTPRRISQIWDETYGVIAQPKLNGERCWVEWYGDEPYLISSYGNQFNLPHITQALKDQNFKKIRFDGELYSHGLSFEQIHSICSTSRKDLHPDYKSISFNIFDYKSGSTQSSRTVFINSLHFNFPLTRVESYFILTKGDWEPLCLSFVDQGYEGIILRGVNGAYSEDRSPYLLKFKPTEKDTYKILSVNEGEGWCEGMLGSFTVSGDDNTPFDVGTGKLLTKPRRKALWDIKECLPGKNLIVKHEKLTTRRGIPKCAVALEIEGVSV